MQIDLDLDVYKRLTELLRTDIETYSDVIRRLLDMHARVPAPGGRKRPDAPDSGGWQRDGVKLPPGTRLRLRYKGVTYYAEIEQGDIKLERGAKYRAPSKAAGAVTGTSVNGWKMWEVQDPDTAGWTTLADLRRRVKRSVA